MKFSLPALVRTTTFRLAVLYGVLFTLFSAILLAYLYLSTVGYIRNESAQALDTEVRELAAAYNTGGLTRLNQSIIERSAAPGRQFFYQLQDIEGRKISGDFRTMPAQAPMAGISTVMFDFDYPQPDGTTQVLKAEGRMAQLGEGGVLLVGFAAGQRTEIVRRITSAVWTAAPIGLLLSLIGGVVISRAASRRAEALAETAEAVMAGDLSRRAPAFNTGDEFDRLAGRMNGMLERIERLMLSARGTGDAIAHDLRSPLSRLRNKIESALAEDMTATSARETMEETIEEVDRVLITFSSILRLSRLEAGEGGRLVRLNVSAVAEEMAELYEPACEEADLGFSYQIERNLFVLGDQELLAQALANLLDNAIKYTPSGAIRLSVKRGREGDVLLSVIDSGPGIPEGQREKAVTRFARLDDARTLPGSGLGLSLVEAAAEVHDGALDLLDGDGPPERPGLRAVLRLPRAK